MRWRRRVGPRRAVGTGVPTRRGSRHGRHDVLLPYLTGQEIASFFGRGDPDDHLRVLNVAHDLSAAEALSVVVELLAVARSDADVALVAGCVLEPIAELRYHEVGPELEVLLRTNETARQAWRGVVTSAMPTDMRSRFDEIANVVVD